MTFSYDRSKTVWGGKQAELLVAQQAHALQIDEHKAMPPIELHVLVQELLKSSPYYADAVSINVIYTSLYRNQTNSSQRYINFFSII